MSNQLKRLFDSKAAQATEVRDRVEEMKSGYFNTLFGIFLGISSVGAYLSYKCTRNVVMRGKVVKASKGPLFAVFGVSFMTFRGFQRSVEEGYVRRVLNTIEVDEDILSILSEENKQHVEEYRKHLFKC